MDPPIRNTGMLYGSALLVICLPVLLVMYRENEIVQTFWNLAELQTGAQALGVSVLCLCSLAIMILSLLQLIRLSLARVFPLHLTDQPRETWKHSPLGRVTLVAMQNVDSPAEHLETQVRATAANELKTFQSENQLIGMCAAAAIWLSVIAGIIGGIVLEAGLTHAWAVFLGGLIVGLPGFCLTLHFRRKIDRIQTAFEYFLDGIVTDLQGLRMLLEASHE